MGPGTYYENLSINKAVTLRAHDSGSMPVIDGGRWGAAVSLNADGITLENLKVVNGEPGIAVGSDNNTITGCVLADSSFRIMLMGSSGNTISGNTLTGKGEGIGLYNGSNNNVIAENVIIGDRPGADGCAGIRLVHPRTIWSATTPSRSSGPTFS